MNNPKNLTAEQIQQAQQAQQSQGSNPALDAGAEVGIGLADMGLGTVIGKDTDKTQAGNSAEHLNTSGGGEISGSETGQAIDESAGGVDDGGGAAGEEVRDWVGELLEGGGGMISNAAEGTAEFAADVVGSIVSGLLN